MLGWKIFVFFIFISFNPSSIILSRCPESHTFSAEYEDYTNVISKMLFIVRLQYILLIFLHYVDSYIELIYYL